MKKALKFCCDGLNLKKQAEELGVSVWQTPNFLFVLMGLIIIIAMTAVYFAAQKYSSPEILVLGEAIVVSIILAIGNSIINTIEEVAKINKMKSEFVSIASHQLQTPLSEIGWEIELLMNKHRKGLDAKQKELIEDITHSNFKMKRLVSDLLDVARIEQGRLFLSRDPIDFLKVVGEVVEDNKILAKSMSVEIKLVKPESLPILNLDKRRIKVALDNLISNAIKYIEKGGYVEIKVEKGKNDVIVSVKDNGVGIPENQQGNIFEKFFRSKNVVRYQTHGTGLGLYITKNIIEQSGGKIWFKSIEGIGSIFSFSLPINNK